MSPPPAAHTLEPGDFPRIVEQNADFVWRSLRRLGVPEASADDAAQQVFLVTREKMSTLRAGRERAFLFAVAMNVAAHVRRSLARRREDATDHDEVEAIRDPAPLPDAALEGHRARALLDEVLAAMPLDLRAVFVLVELEELTMGEVSEVLSIPSGTVASRLRRAREEFHRQAQRVRARVERCTVRPGQGQAPAPSGALALREVSR